MGLLVLSSASSNSNPLWPPPHSLCSAPKPLKPRRRLGKTFCDVAGIGWRNQVRPLYSNVGGFLPKGLRQVDHTPPRSRPINRLKVAVFACPFLVRPSRRKVAVQQLRCDFDDMIAVGGHFEFACSFNDGPVLTHQPPDPAMTNTCPDLYQRLRHPGPTKDAMAQARLFFYVGQNDHMCALPAAGKAAAKGP